MMVTSDDGSWEAPQRQAGAQAHGVHCRQISFVRTVFCAKRQAPPVAGMSRITSSASRAQSLAVPAGVAGRGAAATVPGSEDDVGGLQPFSLEVYFARHEFSAQHLMCCSDAESVLMRELLELADAECRALWDGLSCQYTESGGLPPLRAEIARGYPGLTAADVLCFSGAEEGIYTAMRVLLKRGDHCIIVTPCHQSLRSVATAVCGDGGVTCVELLPQRGWRLDLAALEAAFTPATRMVVMNYPHNPTGALLTAAEQAAVVALCRRHDAYLFFDEVYRGIEAPGVPRLPALAGLYEKGLSLGVVSKALGLAGLRIGWIACPDPDVIARLAGYKHYLSICNSAPSEVLALIALRNHDRLTGRNAAIVAHNLRIVQKELLEHPRYGKMFSWTAPRGGCCGFMRFHGPPGSRRSHGDGQRAADWQPVADAIVKEFSVMTLPGKFFSACTADHFRVGVGRRNLPAVLRHFIAALDALDWDRVGVVTVAGGSGGAARL